MVFKFVWHFVKSEKLFWAWIVLYIFNSVALTLEPLMLKDVVAVIAGETDKLTIKEDFIRAVIFYGSVVMIPILVNYHMNLFKLKTEGKSRLRVVDFLYKKVLHKQISFALDAGTGNISHKINNAYNKGVDLVFTLVSNIMFSGFRFLGFVVIIFMQSRLVGIITLMVSAVYAILYRYFLPKMREKTKQYHHKKDNLFNSIVDSLSNITLLKSFFSKNVERSFDGLSVKLYDAYLDNASLNSILGAIHFCTHWIFSLVVIIVSGYLVVEGKMQVSSFVVVSSTIGALNFHLQNFARGIADFVKLHGTVENTLELLLTEEDFKDLDKISLSEEPSLDYKGGDFEVKDLTFAYHKKDDKNIFENFDLKIKEKETVALVGKSGAGKSTLVALLQRFYDAEKGKILLGGKNVYDYNEDSLREHITYIPQDTSLFSMSVYDNIAYAKPDATKEEVLNAAKLANADEFIEKLPNGYDELVGERGFRLSGGQKQRVAIARAILKNSPIVIMDEATSALDSHSEVLIQQSLDYLLKDKTCIIIAHRLSTIKSADRILVLEDGKIAQEGTHNQLIRKDGAYKNLWSLQQGGFIE